MQKIILLERLQIEGNNNWNIIIAFPGTNCRCRITLPWLQWHPATFSLHHLVCIPPSSDVAMGHPACRWQCPVLQLGSCPPPVALSHVANILQHDKPNGEAECRDRSESFQSGDDKKKDRSSQSSQILAEEMQRICLQICTPLLSLVVVTGLVLWLRQCRTTPFGKASV